MKQRKIILVVRDDIFSKFIYNSLISEYPISKIIIEKKPSVIPILKSKVKREGLLTVFGQLLFRIYVALVLSKNSIRRIIQIKREFNLIDNDFNRERCQSVKSINSEEAISIINRESPDIIIVNGTRIIRKESLVSTDAVFINLHTGITPNYRGVHGGYWSLVNNDAKNFGVTVHIIDKGIDTGPVLFQQRTIPSGEDNFYTYPYLQFGIGVPLVKKAIRAILNDNLVYQDVSKGSSKQWYHPTLWDYIRNKVK